MTEVGLFAQIGVREVGRSAQSAGQPGLRSVTIFTFFRRRSRVEAT
ncbi:hypothetical protein [Saccharopolyspora aridisoli]|nr:hypothetical protein [Saccharopolyspora aridisoli]